MRDGFLSPNLKILSLLGKVRKCVVLTIALSSYDNHLLNFFCFILDFGNERYGWLPLSIYLWVFY